MKFWYQRSWQAYLLLPLSALFWLISSLRRWAFSLGIFASYRAPVPVIVIGNLSVGGNGKTPVVIWLVQQLQQQGFRVGVISRGYGSQSEHYPLLVAGDNDPVQGGDEPVLIAKRTGVPVCIGANRQQNIELLLKSHNCDLIISDDGLQHYRLQRDLEIVVMDSARGFGNGYLLPAGPLRELPSRLAQVDLVIANGEANAFSQASMQLQPKYAVNLQTGEQRLLNQFQQVVAIAGIGNPDRFFNMLEALNIQVLHRQAFQDHQKFDAQSFQKISKKLSEKTPLFMTEKDAVKCQKFAQANWWHVPVEAEIEGEAINQFWAKIRHCVVTTQRLN